MNRMQHAAALGNRYMDIPETVSLLNQERGNNQLFVSLIEGRPTYYADDKTLPALPASVSTCFKPSAPPAAPWSGLLKAPKSSFRFPFDQVVSGSYSLRFHSEVIRLMYISRFFAAAACARQRALASRRKDLQQDDDVHESDYFTVNLSE